MVSEELLKFRDYLLEYRDIIRRHNNKKVASIRLLGRLITEKEELLNRIEKLDRIIDDLENEYASLENEICFINKNINDENIKEIDEMIESNKEIKYDISISNFINNIISYLDLNNTDIKIELNVLNEVVGKCYNVDNFFREYGENRVIFSLNISDNEELILNDFRFYIDKDNYDSKYFKLKEEYDGIFITTSLDYIGGMDNLLLNLDFNDIFGKKLLNNIENDKVVREIIFNTIENTLDDNSKKLVKR